MMGRRQFTGTGGSTATAEILTAAAKAGCDVQQTRNNHWRITHTATGKVVFTSGTTSDHRAAANLKAQIRRELGINL